MKSHALLLSIRPKFALKILQRTKTVELRRLRPNISAGGKILIYASSPEKSLQAIAIVDRVHSACPTKLWYLYKHKVGISYTEFRDYFNGANIGYAIEFKSVQRFKTPVQLSTLKATWPDFHPPQSFRYFTNDELHVFLNTVLPYSQNEHTTQSTISSCSSAREAIIVISPV